MSTRSPIREWLPLAKPGEAVMAPITGEAFRPEWFDFEHGIRVGNLEPCPDRPSRPSSPGSRAWTGGKDRISPHPLHFRPTGSEVSS